MMKKTKKKTTTKKTTKTNYCHPGDRFVYDRPNCLASRLDPKATTDSGEFLLCQIDQNRYLLVSVTTGNRWIGTPLDYDSPRIPADLFQRHFKGHKLTPWRKVS